MRIHFVIDFISRHSSKKYFIIFVAISIAALCFSIFAAEIAFQVSLLIGLIYIIFEENIDMANSPIFIGYIALLISIAIFFSFKVRFTSTQTAGIVYAPILFILYWPLDWMANFLDRAFKIREGAKR